MQSPQQQSSTGIARACTATFSGTSTSSSGAPGYRRRMRVSGLLSGAFALHVLLTARCMPLHEGRGLVKHKEPSVSLLMHTFDALFDSNYWKPVGCCLVSGYFTFSCSNVVTCHESLKFEFYFKMFDKMPFILFSCYIANTNRSAWTKQNLLSFVLLRLLAPDSVILGHHHHHH